MAKSFNAVKISVSGRNLKKRKKENPSWSLGNYEVATTTSSKKFRQLWCCGLFPVWNRLVFCWLCWSICVITTQPEVLANLSRRSKQDKQENPVNLLSTEAITVGYK